MRLLKYLNEKTFRIGADVDLIYNLFFKELIKTFNKGDLKKFVRELQSNPTTSKGTTIGEISSISLKSKQGQKAHELNPITIRCGVFSTSSYTPRKQIIHISLNAQAVNIITVHDMKSMEDIEDMFPSPGNVRRFKSEFTSSAIKGTIYHELSHWMNDTFHDRNIAKRIKKWKQSGDIRKLIGKSSDAMFTDFEIDAQVHALKQLKRDYNKIWDSITWKDVEELKPSFAATRDKLTRSLPKEQTRYMKIMLKRLNREKLLGKKLQTTFKYMIGE